jgi:hypothetical protein
MAENPSGIVRLSVKIRILAASVAVAFLAGCSAAPATMSDEASCAEIAKSINIINGFLASSTGDPNEATAVFTEVAKSLETIAEQTEGEKSQWVLKLAESAADASVSIMSQDSEKLTSSIEALLTGMAFEATYCPAN